MNSFGIIEVGHFYHFILNCGSVMDTSTKRFPLKSIRFLILIVLLLYFMVFAYLTLILLSFYNTA